MSADVRLLAPAQVLAAQVDALTEFAVRWRHHTGTGLPAEWAARWWPLAWPVASPPAREPTRHDPFADIAAWEAWLQGQVPR